MGLKFASWRHPDVFVMAPALTEAGQSQNFKLPPTHSLPASPISVALNELKNLPVSKLLSNGHLLCNGSLASKFQETKPFDNQCIKRVAKDLYKESLYSKSLFLSEVTSIKESGRLPLPSEDAKASGNIATDKKGGYMMSECDPSMGDQDTMGLHKSSASLEADSLLKEKTLSNEMDQLFKNLGAAISSNDLESSADLGQNVEELLQVIKSIESGAADGVEMCHMDPVETAESESMFPTDFTGALSTFERELLNDVDVMNMCVGDVDTSSGLENKEVHTKERIEEAHKRQFELERRCERLLRRLRKYQARVMGKHVAEEVTSLLEFVQRTIRTTPHREGGDVNSSEGAGSSKTDGKGSPLMGLLRKLDMISQQQAAVSARHHVINKYFGSGSSDRSPSSHGQPYGLRTLPRLTTETKLELEHVSGRMHTQLKLVETSMDSDATASSSGGESCDEMQAFNNHHQVHVSICKRAAWRWGQDRAGVASRWTWLQAQISDLEYRIRQHTDLHRQIRATKGPVSLGEASGVASSPGRVVVNGFHGPVKESSGSGRTRPLMRSAFRKRRLLPTDGLHRTSKKAARPSSVRCGCRPGPLGSSCPLCTGRSDPMEGQQPDTLTAGERVALLDPTFHPVLSFRDDIPSGLHYDAVMRMAEWQQRTLRTLRAAKVVDKDRGLQDRRTKTQHQHSQQHVRRKYIRRKPLASSTLTAKIKHKLSVRGRKPKNHHQEVGKLSLHRMRQRRRQSSRGPATPNTIVAMSAIVPALTVAGADEEAEGEESMAGSKNPSPIPSPLGFSLGKDLLSYRRKRENSYDIDNIVIPYSIAAATRVEKLPYKEIPTPKWRVAELNTKLDLKNNGMVRHSSEDSDVEDLNEDTIVARHERCEVDEKKKFMSYLKFPHSGRSRAHRRTDSMAESSGANTPDPMSPQSIIDPSTSPMASPPATPLSILVEGDGPVTRRPRTASVSLVLRPSTPTQPEHYIEVAPYETRTYPLPEGMYETLLSQMPEGHPFPPCPATPKNHLTKDNYDSDHSTPASPSSDSTESALGEGEDPNDPEWTVFSNVKR